MSGKAQLQSSSADGIAPPAVQLARNMALLPIDSQLPPEYLERTGGSGAKHPGGVDPQGTRERNPHTSVHFYKEEDRPPRQVPLGNPARDARPMRPRNVAGPSQAP